MGRPPPLLDLRLTRSPLSVQVLNVNVPNSDPAKGPGPSSFAITCPGIINYVGEHRAVHRASYSEPYTCLPSPPQHMYVLLVACCSLLVYRGHAGAEGPWIQRVLPVWAACVRQHPWQRLRGGYVR